jgi:hypothetical protein
MTKFNWERAKGKIGLDPYSKEGSITLAEMEHIMGNRRLLDRTDFFENGKNVNKQDVIDRFNKAKQK